MRTRLRQWALHGLCILFLVAISSAPRAGLAAPYAAMVIDARSGEVLHSRNADTRLHPASLTKMMTLYVVFEAVENGEISLDTKVRISRNAASEPPSKLGLREGQRIALRYLIRAAAVKSANDAATALGEAISGSEAAFARRMNRTAKALGMTRTTFKNAHGLTESGHLSTARDMTKLGRHLFYDYPEYYNLFSRQTTNAGIRDVANTNRRFLSAYRGADGIKTGYTRAAGFNLVASAERGRERIIATVFGGRSTASRNQRVAELLDMGFKRAPSRVAVVKPRKPAYQGPGTRVASAPESVPASAIKNGIMPASKVIRVSINIKSSPIPRLRPGSEPAIDDATLMALQKNVASTVQLAQAQETAPPAPAPSPNAEQTAQSMALLAAQATSAATLSLRPKARPKALELADAKPAQQPPATTEPEVVTRLSTSGGRHWGINIGLYGSRYEAERVLLKTALTEVNTLDMALRKVVKTPRGFDANFVGLDENTASLACRRLQARNMDCTPIGPS